jgi:hypothetical protein
LRLIPSTQTAVASLEQDSGLTEFPRTTVAESDRDLDRIAALEHLGEVGPPGFVVGQEPGATNGFAFVMWSK